MTVKWLECKEGSGQVAERAGILVNKEIILSSFENKEITLSWSQNKWTHPVLKLVLTSPLIRALVVLFTTAIPSPKINAKTYQCSHQQLRRAHINLAKIWSRLSSQPSDFGSQYIYAVLVAAGPFLWSSVDRFLFAYDWLICSSSSSMQPNQRRRSSSASLTCLSPQTSSRRSQTRGKLLTIF